MPRTRRDVRLLGGDDLPPLEEMAPPPQPPDVVARGKRRKTDTGPAAAAPARDGCGGGRVESLATLASRVAERHLLARRKRIPHDAHRLISRRREGLERQLDALENERSAYARKQTAALNADQDRALVELAVAGGPDRFCGACKKFYHSRRTEWRCSADGCEAHLKCPNCVHTKKKWGMVGGEGMYIPDHDDVSEGESGGKNKSASKSESGAESDYTADSDFRPGDYFEENPPSDLDEMKRKVFKVDCWICDAEFCNRHFKKHYPKCRAKARHRCGFRPGSCNNGGKNILCVPGHCGRDIAEVGKGRYYVCTPDDRLCNTTCCEECVSVCRDEAHADPLDFDMNPYDDEDARECGRISCKEHAKQRCYGSCSNGY